MRKETNQQYSPEEIKNITHDGLQILARIIVDVVSKEALDRDSEPVEIQVVKTDRQQGGDAA